MLDFEDIQAAINRANVSELSTVCLQLWGRVSYLESVPKKRQKAIAKATDPAREAEEKDTWLTPAKDAYEAEMGVASFPYSKAASALAGLYRGGWDPKEIGRRLGYYLRTLKRSGELKFLSFPRFVEQIGTYDPNEPAFENEG